MSTVKNFITEDTTIKGSITTASSLTVAGAIEGDINAGGEIAVLEDAVIKGDVSGPNIKIDGKVEGRISASGRLVIAASGKVYGDISVRSLLIEEGGTLEGQCHMGANAGASSSTSPRASGLDVEPIVRPSVSAPPLRPPVRS
jgi:cytoskeletal protein CcmA (bactofilin family)